MSLQPSSVAVAAGVALASAYTGIRWYNADKHKYNLGPAFFGLYIDEEGQSMICRSDDLISKRRLILDKKTMEVGILPWEDQSFTEKRFNLWKYLDDEIFVLSALSALKPLFVSHLAPTHCTFVHPHSLPPEKIEIFAAVVTQAGLADHAYPFTLHSAVIHGLSIPLSWWDISTIAVVLPNGKCMIASPVDCSTDLARSRIMSPNETTVVELTSDMRLVEQIILLDNKHILSTGYTPYMTQEPLDIIVRGASLWGKRRTGTSPIWFTRAPKIDILVADSTSSTQPVVHPALKPGASKTGQAIVTTVVDGQTGIEVRVLYDEHPLTSLIISGLAPLPAAEVEVVFCVSVFAVGGMSEAILQLVERKSGLRVSRRVKLVKCEVTWTDEPIQVALSKTQSSERPVCSDYDLFMAAGYPED